MGVVNVNSIAHTKSDNEATKLRSAKTVFDTLDKRISNNIANLNDVYTQLYLRYQTLGLNYITLLNNYNILYDTYTAALERKEANEIVGGS